MDPISSYLIAALGALAAGGATVVAWVALNRGARKERADAAAKFTEHLHEIELLLRELTGRVGTLEQADQRMQGELAGQWLAIDVKVDKAADLVQQLLAAMGDIKANVASNTAFVQALTASNERDFLRRQQERQT